MTNYTDPTIIVDLENKKRIKPLTWYLLGSALLVLLGLGYAFYQNLTLQKEIDQQGQQVTTLNQTYTTLSPVKQDLQRLSTQASRLSTLFNNQRSWAYVLKQFDAGLYPDMVINNLQIKENGEVTVAGFTRDYTDYAKIFLSFTSDDAKKLWISAKPGGVTVLPENKEFVGLNVQFSFTLNLASWAMQSNQYTQPAVTSTTTSDQTSSTN